MVLLPVFPPANGHVIGMPRRHKPDAESNIPTVKARISMNAVTVYIARPVNVR